jgi:putative membrane protein
MFVFRFFLYRLLVNIIGIAIAAIIFKHIAVTTFFNLIVSAFILTMLNIFLKPFFLLLTLPLQLLSFGLFYLVIIATILKLTSLLVEGFYIDGFWAAVGGSIIIGCVNFVFDIFAKNADMRYISWK